MPRAPGRFHSQHWWLGYSMWPAQWLATTERVKDEREVVFEDGISRFFPKHSRILKLAVGGTYPRRF